MALPNPVKVSPVIKFFRYTFLIVGIIYGVSKRKAFQTIESSKKEERERLKLLRNAEIEKQKKATAEKEMAEFAAIFYGESESKLKTEEQGYDTSEVTTTPCKVEEVKQEVDDKVNALAHMNETDASQNPENEAMKNTQLTDKDDYYVENFSSKIPYVTPDNNQFNLYPKNIKK